MDSREKISCRQFLALAFVALLSPIVRRMPRSLVMYSGGASWLAVPIAALPCIGVFLLIFACLKRRRGLDQLIEDSLGKVIGRVLVGAVSLWLVFYCGFLLHSSAHRVVSTVYSDSSPTIFILLMALLCLLAAMGPFCALGRSAMLFRPLLLGVLAVVCVFAFGDCRFQGVLNVTREDLLPGVKSGAVVLNTLSLAAYLCFAARRAEGEIKRGTVCLWCAVLLVIVELMCLGCLGVFGTELTLKLNYPFFMLVRDISIFDSLARMEALVVAVWMVADFQLIGLMLRIASDCLRRCFGQEAENSGSLLSLRQGRWLTPACTLAAAAVALCIPRDILSLGQISEKLVPIVNAGVIFALIPLALLIGRLRQKI